MNETSRKLESAGFVAKEEEGTVIAVRGDGLEVRIAHDGLEIMDKAGYEDNRHVSGKPGIWRHSDTILTMGELKAILEAMLSVKGRLNK